MNGLLLDSDVLIDHLRGVRRVAPRDGMCVSVVTRCELFAGPAEQETAVRELLEPLEELLLDSAIAEAAGRIRREAGVRTPDALIAATAIVHGLELATRNRRDFAPVPGLVLASGV